METILLNLLTGGSFAFLVWVLGVSPATASYWIFFLVAGVHYYIDFRRWLQRRRDEL